MSVVYPVIGNTRAERKMKKAALALEKAFLPFRRKRCSMGSTLVTLLCFRWMVVIRASESGCPALLESRLLLLLEWLRIINKSNLGPGRARVSGRNVAIAGVVRRFVAQMDAWKSRAIIKEKQHRRACWRALRFFFPASLLWASTHNLLTPPTSACHSSPKLVGPGT